MERQLYFNGKPLVRPPPRLSEVLQSRLDANKLDFAGVNQLNSAPQLTIIDTEGLKSTFVNKNPLFQALLQQIMDWNESVTLFKAGMKPLKHPMITDRLFRSLRNQLLEVVNCRNRIQQENYLQKVVQWFADKLDAPQRRALSQSLISQEEDLAYFHQRDVHQSMYMSPTKDYHNNNRSIHKDFEPPEDRVKNFTRKSLVMSDISTRPGTTPGHLGISQLSRPDTSQTQYKMSEAVDKGVRPRTNQYMTSSKAQASFLYDTNFPVFETFEEQNATKRKLFSSTESPLKHKQSQEEFDDPEQEGDEEDASPDMKQSQQQDSPLLKKQVSEISSPLKLRKKKRADKYVSTAPQKKPFKDDKNTLEAYREVQSMRSGELQYHYAYSEEEQEVVHRLNKIYLTNRYKEIKEQREDDEMINNMQEWATNKGRIDEMIVHNGCMTHYGSSFSKVGVKTSYHHQPKQLEPEEDLAYSQYLNRSCVQLVAKAPQPQQQNEPQIIENNVPPTQIEEEVENYQEKQAFLEKKISNSKLSLLKKSRGSWLPGGINNSQSSHHLEARRQQSVSCFKNAAEISSNRAFSGIFRSYSIKQVADQQVTELNLIKARLASQEHFIPVTTLKKSLIIPQGLKDPTKVPLPYPVGNLPEKKKGKKKKKKSKK